MENLNNWIIVTNDFIWTYILVKPCSSVSGSTLHLQRFGTIFGDIREMFRLLGDGIASGTTRTRFLLFKHLHCNRSAGWYR